MAEKVLAAVKIGPKETETRDFQMPDIPIDAGLLKVEAAGICGSDVNSYPRPLKTTPHIMGHENVGTIAKVGRIAARCWGVKEGDRVALEEYLPCGHCQYCRSGDFRLCYETDIHNTPNAARYGTTPVKVPPSLWGGFSHYLYLHPNSVFHRVPDHVPGEQAAMALPLGNGWQWAYVEGGITPGKSVLIQGPGQQGLGCVIAAKEAGAGCIMVAGLSRDTKRLEVASKLGADYTINVEKEDLRERVREITAGQGADVVIDVAAATEKTILPALDVLNKKRGTLVIAAGKMEQRIEGFPIGIVKLKYLAVKGARGHSYQSVEMALRTIASGKYPLQELCSHQFDLSQVDQALRTASGEGLPDPIHVTVAPWQAA
ncbi:MAG: zinc-binding dehydrogenase [Dehalococcoidia bacterium]